MRGLEGLSVEAARPREREGAAKDVCEGEKTGAFDDVLRSHREGETRETSARDEGSKDAEEGDEKKPQGIELAVAMALMAGPAVALPPAKPLDPSLSVASSPAGPGMVTLESSGAGFARLVTETSTVAEEVTLAPLPMDGEERDGPGKVLLPEGMVSADAGDAALAELAKAAEPPMAGAERSSVEGAGTQRSANGEKGNTQPSANAPRVAAAADLTPLASGHVNGEAGTGFEKAPVGEATAAISGGVSAAAPARSAVAPEALTPASAPQVPQGPAISLASFVEQRESGGVSGGPLQADVARAVSGGDALDLGPARTSDEDGTDTDPTVAPGEAPGPIAALAHESRASHGALSGSKDDGARRDDALRLESAERRQEAATTGVSRMALRKGAHAEIDAPGLGRIAVDAKNHASEVDIRIVADSAASVEVLRAARADLETHLRSSAVSLGQLAIGGDAGPSSGGSRGRGDAPDHEAHDVDTGSVGRPSSPLRGRVRIVL